MGIHDIKLNNCEKQKRWDWEKIQSKLYKVNLKGLSLSQTQHIGATTINESKNIIITFIAAVSVMDGNMTLGMMLAVQYIIGQLNAPIDNMILFLHNLQDAKMSLERINEIHKKDDEEEPDENRITAFPKHNKSIKIENMSFRYEGPHSDYVIKDMNFDIPEGKVTAIVGASGSGKTTFIKLLLGFYKPTKGKILLDDVNLHNYSSSLWRSKTGVVMQEGFIFSDTIAGNIAISDETIDKEKLLKAVKIANIQDFIESLALRYNTKIGMDGQPLSQGQKQRILIARAVYKNPDFMFFDEATNSLDANNERVIMENLEKFYEGKTVIVVAHRLSTVKNADKIIVLEYGKIIESGNHHELVEKKGAYYNLVKNQLELGN
jgi:ATP-binding cassette subfamily B protein